MGDFGIDLVEQVMLHWRVRCVLRRAGDEVTSGPDALSVVTALVASLELGYPPAGLRRAVRAWADGVGDAEDRRRALACLVEVFARMAAATGDEAASDALDAALEQVAAEAATLVVSEGGEAPVGPGRSPQRRLLERRLAHMAAEAAANGGDVALGLFEPERRPPAAGHVRGRSRSRPGDMALVQLAACLGRLAGEGNVYRLGPRRLVVVMARATDSAGLGDVVLRATAGRVPPFVWGTASLGAAGSGALGRPDSLLVLAEADLHRRRRDLRSARRQLARHRRRAGLAAVTSVLVLATGVLVGVHGAVGRPPSARSALPTGGAGLHQTPSAGAPTGPPASTSTPPSTSTPGASTPTSTDTAAVQGSPSPAAAGRPPAYPGGGSSAQLTTGAPSPTPPSRGPGSATPPPGSGSTTPPSGAGSPPAPVTAVLDQFLSTASGLLGGVVSLAAPQAVSAGPRATSAGVVFLGR